MELAEAGLLVGVSDHLTRILRRFTELRSSFQGISADLTRHTGGTGLVRLAFVATAMVVHSGNAKW